MYQTKRLLGRKWFKQPVHFLPSIATDPKPQAVSLAAPQDGSDPIKPVKAKRQIPSPDGSYENVVSKSAAEKLSEALYGSNGRPAAKVCSDENIKTAWSPNQQAVAAGHASGDTYHHPKDVKSVAPKSEPHVARQAPSSTLCELEDSSHNPEIAILLRARAAREIRSSIADIQIGLKESSRSLLKSPLVHEPGPPNWEQCHRGRTGYCDESLDAIFHRRLTSVWTCLFDSARLFPDGKATSAKLEDLWISRISDCIPMQVKALLVADHCPKYEELQELPTADSREAGVYAWLVESRYETGTASDRLVCIGTADRIGGGLEGWTKRHHAREMPYFAPRRETPEEEHNLQCAGKLVTLMMVTIPPKSDQDPPYVPTLTRVTQIILAVWLGSFQEHSLSAGDLFPWKIEKTDFTVVVP